jgi:prostatic aicd phosphatase
MNCSELRRLITLSRHGSRAPNEVVERICPNNSNNIHSYNVPFEQLTEFGMMQLLQAGEHIRDVYVDKKSFLSSSLNGDNNFHLESYFRSDAATRCSQSATALGYGLYPDGTGPKGFPKQPIPITMQLIQNEHEFAAPKGPCKSTLAKDLQQYANSRFKELRAQHDSLLKEVSNLCGVDLSNVESMNGGEDTVFAVKDIADMFIFDRDQGLPRIAGLTHDLSFSLEALAFTTLMEHFYSTDRQVTYWVGGFPNMLLDNLNSAASPTYPVERVYKYFSYHGHRELLHGMGKLLGWDFHFHGLPVAMNTTSLHPGTTMFFELHASKNPDGVSETYFIRTFVWSPKTEREAVKLSKCSSIECPLSEFNNIINDHFAKTGTWEEICDYHPKNEKLTQVTATGSFNHTVSAGYLIIVGVALCVCAFTVFGIFIWKVNFGCKPGPGDDAACVLLNTKPTAAKATDTPSKC